MIHGCAASSALTRASPFAKDAEQTRDFLFLTLAEITGTQRMKMPIHIPETSH